MSDYTKITDFSQKDVVQALIEGVDFDNEFSAVAAASATKTDKIAPAAADSLAGLNASGNLTDSGILISNIQAAQGVVTGSVFAYAGNSPPAGFLFADGSSELTASYPDLFGVIGYTYGGSGTNFNMPDLRGRVAAGRDNMGGTSANRITNSQADSLGGSMGEELHALTQSEGPVHNHGGATGAAGGHSHSGGVTSTDGDQGGGGSAAARQTGSTGSVGNHTHSITASGSGTAHNNVQPTLFLHYIIKT